MHNRNRRLRHEHKILEPRQLHPINPIPDLTNKQTQNNTLQQISRRSRIHRCPFIQNRLNSPKTLFNNISENKGNITDLGFEKDGKWMYTSSEDGVVQIFDYRAKGYQMKYENSCGVNTAVLHPMQTEIYFGDDKGNIYIWDLVKNEPSLLQEDSDQVSIRSIDITIDGSKIVAANSEGMLFTRVAFEDSQSLPQEEIEAHPGSYILKCKFSR